MLDTNICIYLMKHHPPEVARRFADCYVGEVVISAITLQSSNMVLTVLEKTSLAIGRP